MEGKQVMAAVLAVMTAVRSMFTGYGSSKDSGSTAQQDGQEQAGVSGRSGKDQSGSSQSGEGNGEQTTVTFWAIVVTEGRQGLFDWFASHVTEVYPDVKVDMLGVPGDLSDYRQKLDVAIQAGTAPDITNNFRPELVLNGYYGNLNPYFENWGDKNKISGALTKSNKTYGPTGEELCVLPYSSQTWDVQVRPDWLREIGMDAPANWNDSFTTVEEVTDASNDKYGLCIHDGAGSASALEMLMYVYSGLDHHSIGDGRSTINDPKNVEFVQKYLVDYYNVYTAQGDLTKSWANLASPFQFGKARIMVHNLGPAVSIVQAFEEDYSKFQVAKSPACDGGYMVHAGLTPLGLSMNSQPQNKEAVWKVISLYLSKGINTKYCQLYGEIPADMEAAQDPFFKDSPYMSMGVDIETSADVRFNDTPYYSPTYSNIQSDTESNIQIVTSGEMIPQELLGTWVTALEETYVDYNESIKQ